MDYTDGSKEAKLLQELLHLIEEAVFRGGSSLQGNFPEVIMKEMREKGFSGNDFSTTLINQKFEKQYHLMLEKEGVSYLKVPDVNSNMVLIVRSEDRIKLLDVDACIKKGSSDYTRAEYVTDFLKNERRLGNEIYRLKMSDPQTHAMLADKSFDHPAGFVTSYSAGYCYFSESAADSEIATLFLDTAISSVKGSFLDNVKQMNRHHETANYDRVIACMENGDTMNFVNIFDNSSDYLHVENRVLYVHSFCNKMDMVVESVEPKDYGDGKQESLHDKIVTKLTDIHNCKSIGDGELAVHLKKTSTQLAAEREAALYVPSGLVADLEAAPSPEAIESQSIYLAMDRQTLWDIGKLLREKLDVSTNTAERADLKRRLNANSKLISLTEARDGLRTAVKREIKKMKASSKEYAYLSSKEKLMAQRDMAIYVLKNMDLPEVSKYLETSGVDLDNLTVQYEECFGKIETVSDVMEEQILSDAQIQTQAPSNFI